MRALILAVILIIAPVAAAHDASHPELDSWYASLKQPGNGVSCCDKTDCKTTEYRLTNAGEYEAWVDEQWLVTVAHWEMVPASKILRGVENLAALAVLCRGVGDHGPLYCFLPGSDT